MKVITLWQPWATWVILGWKTIETRLHPRFASLVGQRIGIHAGLKWDENALDLAGPYLLETQKLLTHGMTPSGQGTLIGTVYVDSHRILTGADSQKALIDCGGTTRYGLILVAPFMKEHIPMKGKQGIWHIDDHLVKEITS